jgi:hypothetical protein
MKEYSGPLASIAEPQDQKRPENGNHENDKHTQS